MEHPELCKGRLRIGVIAAAPGEAIEKRTLDLALREAEFPEAEEVSENSGKRLRRRTLLGQIVSSSGSVAVDSSRFLERLTELRWFGPGDDDFPRNAALAGWLIERVRESVRAPFPRHQRHVVFLHHMPSLPPEIAPHDLNGAHVLYSLGRRITQEAIFIAIVRDGRLDFLKNRSGPVFPEASWKV